WVHRGEKVGKGWFPQEPKKRRTCDQMRSWDNCYRQSCRVHKREKIAASYYPRKDGGKDPLTKRDETTRKRREAVRTRLEGEGTEKPQEEREGSTATLLDPESLLRQINELGSMLDEANKTINDQWGIIDEKSRTIEVSGNLLETVRRQYRLEAAEASRLRKRLRRLGRTATE